MYEIWYDYVKPKHGKKEKVLHGYILCHIIMSYYFSLYI